MRPEDFQNSAKIRSMVLHMMEARGGMIHGGREHLEYAANHLNQIAALYEKHARKMEEVEILKAAGIRRMPEPTMAATVADAAAKKRKAAKDKDDR